MKIFKIIIKIVFLLIIIFYLSLPLSAFPQEIKNSYQSFEPADLEDINRRGYYLDLTRNEVTAYYSDQFRLFGIFSAIRLNYPPEEAQTLIRDQTRSTYLEEFVFPLRESLFINGFEPRTDNEAIVINGKRYGQKIIVKKVESNIFMRIIIGIFIYYSFNLLIKELLIVSREAILLLRK